LVSGVLLPLLPEFYIILKNFILTLIKKGGDEHAKNQLVLAKRKFVFGSGFIGHADLLEKLNTFLWPVIIIGALLANVAPRVGFSMMIFELTVNNFMHTIIFQSGKPAYNPGLITNSVLLLPLGTITFITALPIFQCRDWIFSIILGALICGFLAFKTRSRLASLKK